MAAFRGADWAGDIGHGQTLITVVVKQLEVQHKVRMRDFEAWLESNGRWRAKTQPERAISDCAPPLRESPFFAYLPLMQNWQRSYWGSNYPRLLEIKKKYDPSGLFIVHNGVGSEEWSTDGFTKV